MSALSRELAEEAREYSVRAYDALELLEAVLTDAGSRGGALRVSRLMRQLDELSDPWGGAT